jgi:hypothetical protein
MKDGLIFSIPDLAAAVREAEVTSSVPRKETAMVYLESRSGRLVLTTSGMDGETEASVPVDGGGVVSGATPIKFLITFLQNFKLADEVATVRLHQTKTAFVFTFGVNGHETVWEAPRTKGIPALPLKEAMGGNKGMSYSHPIEITFDATSIMGEAVRSPSGIDIRYLFLDFPGGRWYVTDTHVLAQKKIPAEPAFKGVVAVQLGMFRPGAETITITDFRRYGAIASFSPAPNVTRRVLLPSVSLRHTIEKMTPILDLDGWVEVGRVDPAFVRHSAFPARFRYFRLKVSNGKIMLSPKVRKEDDVFANYRIEVDTDYDGADIDLHIRGTFLVDALKGEDGTIAIILGPKRGDAMVRIGDTVSREITNP